MRDRAIPRIVLAVLLALAAPRAAAQGMIVVGGPGTGTSASPGLTLRLHSVDVRIHDQVATTRITQVYRNDSGADQEAVYLFPLPRGAAIYDFAMLVGSKTLETRLLRAEEARRIYEDIVRQKKDPALLEFVGRDAIQARIYPVPAQGERRIEITYSQALPLDQGLVRYSAALAVSGFTSTPVESVAVRVSIDSAHAVKAVYSPSHPIAVHRDSDRRAVASYETHRTVPDRDFELCFGLSEEALGLHLLTYREPGEDGYFLMMLAPRFEVAESDLLPRDVVFVLDTSGSMQGDKIRQARTALSYCVRSLRPKDRFNLLAFHTAVQAFENGLVPVTPDAVGRAVSFTEGLEARGGTNIQAALRSALRMLEDRSRSSMVVFLTDGLPTIGETDLAVLEKEIGRENARGARLYVFGVGNDVNTHFLDRVAAGSRGLAEYVREREAIDVKVTSFFAKISHPVLADVTLTASGAHAYDFYPPDAPDLYRGAQLLLFGRYRGTGPVRVVVRGKVEGREREFVFERSFPPADLQDAFVARIWASQKIGFLLDEIRLRGRSRELVDEVIALSRRHGIMTEYTSFLIDEDGTAPAAALRAAALDNFDRAFREQNGDWAISQCQNGENYKRNDNVAGINVILDRAGYAQRLERVRAVAGKVFYRRGNAWVDVEALGLQVGEVVENFSPRYFELTGSEEQFNFYQALGEEVIVKQGNRVIHCR